MGTRILIVEDEANIADYLVKGLREEGFTVEHAPESGAAWEALVNQSWDAVLLDWWLPGQDGLALLRRFRSRDKQTPVLFLTAREQVECRVLGLDAGADDYLCKPFDFDELLARIRAILRRRERSSESLLAYADLRVDLATQLAERAGQPLDLTAKEFSLLVYLIRHPERLLPRNQIYEHVWHERVDEFSNTLGVHVMDLRRKLETLGPRLIHTMRGRGYYFGTSPKVGGTEE